MDQTKMIDNAWNIGPEPVFGFLVVVLITAIYFLWRSNVRKDKNLYDLNTDTITVLKDLGHILDEIKASGVNHTERLAARIRETRKDITDRLKRMEDATNESDS